MRQQEFFEYVIHCLEDLSIPYMVTGSVAAMLFGEPRMTNDMDVVVRLRPEQVIPFLDQFPPEEYYTPPPEVVRDELLRLGQFNIIHGGSGSKVDLILRKSTEFARMEFSRRFRSTLTPGRDCQSATPEDIVLSKLMSYREGGSEKHLRDIRGILGVSGDEIDREYLDHWIGRLGLAGEWEMLEGG